MLAMTLEGVNAVLWGGDSRTRFMCPFLESAGLALKRMGEIELDVPPAEPTDLAEADLVILPMTGIDLMGRAVGAKNIILDDSAAELFKKQVTVVVGNAGPNLVDLCARRGWGLTHLVDSDELAYLNAVPTAEGAVQYAMEHSDITLAGATAVVLGFGRCAIVLAQMLAALHMNVIVAARKSTDRAKAQAFHFQATSFERLSEVLPLCDFVFNTVPAMVLSQAELALTRPRVYILDLASAPGGCDFEAAQRLGRAAELAPGLPGKVAPRTAGEILGKVIVDVLEGLKEEGKLCSFWARTLDSR
jgi:dipicolinate synthase subunit A